MADPAETPVSTTEEQEAAAIDAVRAKRRLDPIGLTQSVSLSDRQRVYELLPQDTDVLADSLASSLEEPVLLRIRFRPELVAGGIGVD